MQDLNVSVKSGFYGLIELEKLLITSQKVKVNFLLDKTSNIKSF